MTLTNAQWEEAIVSLANAGPSGGGTQYTDGGTPPANPIGPTIIWDNGGTWIHVSAANPLPVTGGGGGTQYVDAGTPPTHPTGTVQVWDNSGAWVDVGLDHPLPVQGTFWQTTQPVSGTFWQTTQPVSGTFWQTTQPISGSVTTSGTVTEANSAAILADIATTVPGVQGWIAATGTGTATTDDSLTFASQVRKVVLYNAAAVPVPFEFDATSSATSIPIQPGQYMVFDDILCTVVHVFPSATLPINTTAGLYVKGWK